jgi:selenocysteine lyase/cysteine desulfurase
VNALAATSGDTVASEPVRTNGAAPVAVVSAAPIPRSRLVGADRPVPLLDGRHVRYINLDNAASTPALRSVVDTIEEFLPYYSGVHRGTGYKSRLSTAVFEQAREIVGPREIVGQFVGADPDRDVVVFTKNTTEAINKVAHTLRLDRDAVVVTTGLEHHSNELPWRSRTHIERVAVCSDGALDIEHVELLLRKHAGRCPLLAVSGASNVTGVVQPIHELAAKVHAVGGRILVDAAQLAPHRRIDMRPHGDPGHLDFVAMSAHKIYAPYGTGALVGPRDAFGPEPYDPGGGTVRAVTTESIAWADLPDREEAGSPNVVGAVALAAAIRELTRVDLDHIARHERQLMSYAIDSLSRVPGLRTYGPAPVSTADASAPDRLGVIAFTIDDLDHGLVAAILGYEHGVGVRSGCFCAQQYVAKLLGLDPVASAAWLTRARRGDKRHMPGLVRISLGCYNDSSDVDAAVEALRRAVAGDVAGSYRADRDGSFHPREYVERLLFTLDR